MDRRFVAVSAIFFVLLVDRTVAGQNDFHDFRHISYQDLESGVDTFAMDGITTYSQLLFDVARNQVLVGARDVLFRLNLSDLKLLEFSNWTAPQRKTEICLAKGQSEENCHNFIKVLIADGSGKVFVCGTDSFSPTCTWRDIENINSISEVVDGVVKCPYNPAANVTSLITQEGDYYVGGSTDFSGSDFAIYRGTSIRTKQYDSMWLNEPQFVASFETDRFVYFLFREAAVEYINCGKVVYSRIGRVCKNDSGGKVMLRNNWTTFVKARLNCSITGQYPFYYNEIQSAVYLESENILYATFTTAPNGIVGSAICAFNMSAIEEAFRGPFKYQEHVGNAWSKHYSENQGSFECAAPVHTKNLIESSKYKLMDQAVQSTSLRPLYDMPLERFTHITVDVLATKTHPSVHVLFVANTNNDIKKITVIPGSGSSSTCLVEEWKGVSPPNIPIFNMQFLKETNSVYVATKKNVIRISADHCLRHRSKESCRSAMDPYCGWNEIRDDCTSAPFGEPLDKYWLQELSSCPILDAKIDGGWSSWSEWAPCAYSSDDNDECLCKTRACNNPSPRGGGKKCEGHSIAVTNCTVHGGWTKWSAWSECSATCGIAVKTRTRTCTNPTPAHGGRICVGFDRTEVLCIGNPPCPVATPTPQDGGWSNWEPWGSCSESCGRGFRTRIRKCNNPPPLSGGSDCSGSNIEYGFCHNTCSEQRKTMSVSVNFTQPGGKQLRTKRIKFVCHAPVASQSLIRISHREEICVDGLCDEEASHWSQWSNWSSCSVSCGYGQQTRYRQCKGGKDCQGPNTQTKSCHRQSCPSAWGCWTDWSPCSSTCGWGIRKRYRECLGDSCRGESMQEEQCENAPCGSLLGWGEWTAWSECDKNQEQHRRRFCKSAYPGPHMCQGPNKETRMCVINDQLYQSQEEVRSVTAVTMGICLSSIVGFMIGCAVMYLVKCYYRKKRRIKIPSSPHYMSAKMNPYIAVPYLDSKRSSKRQSSATTSTSLNNSSYNGTIKSVKDYDTLKRNSHAQNNIIKMELADDKFYE